MSFYALIYTLCAVEFVDILDFLSDDVKTILMFLIAVVSIIIQIVRAVKGNKNKTDVEKIMDTIYDKLKGDKQAVENKEEVNNMYEVQMSPLVEKICNIYAQENGLNYPPCTQQMLNAVAEWLNNNAISDIKSVTAQNTENTVTLNITYTHPDNSTIEQTISFTVPVINGKDGKDGLNGTNGADGKDGVCIERFVRGVPYVAGGDTVTPITVYYSDGNHGDFSVIAKNGVDGTNGTNGTDGNGIVSIHSLGHSTVGNETVTNVEVVTDNGNQTFEVHAVNGAQGTPGEPGSQTKVYSLSTNVPYTSAGLGSIPTDTLSVYNTTTGYNIADIAEGDIVIDFSGNVGVVVEILSGSVRLAKKAQIQVESSGSSVKLYCIEVYFEYLTGSGNTRENRGVLFNIYTSKNPGTITQPTNYSTFISIINSFLQKGCVFDNQYFPVFNEKVDYIINANDMLKNETCIKLSTNKVLIYTQSNTFKTLSTDTVVSTEAQYYQGEITVNEV